MAVLCQRVQAQEVDPATIACTSDFVGFKGFRVVIRERAENREPGSGKRGAPFFGLCYRPGEERGGAVFRFSQKAEPAVPTAGVRTIGLQDIPFEATDTEADGKLVSFEIHPEFLADVIRRANIHAEKLQRMLPTRFVVNKSVEFLCFLLRQETENGAQLGTFYFESLARALVIALMSQLDSRPPDTGNANMPNERVQQAVSYIEANFRSKLTLAEIAAASRLSVSHLCRLFGRIVGLTPHEYILNCRLHFAERLLCSRGAGCLIADVAAEAGFADQAHFCRHFRRAFRKTPYEYRRQRK
jgi:AraC-like DNA-binding protein